MSARHHCSCDSMHTVIEIVASEFCFFFHNQYSMSHLFEEKTFGHLTYCKVCNQLLWGVIKQGLECKECHYTCHRKCQTSASKCPNAIPSRFLDDTPHEDSRAEQYLRQLKQRTDNEPQSASSAKPIKANSSQTLSGYQHVRALATSDKLHTILADAMTDQSEPVNAYLANQPALNPQITTKNFTRFVSRCGPVFAFRDELLLLLSWKNKVDTLISMIVYIAFCLHPKLLLFVPQAVILYFILSSNPKVKEKGKSAKVDEREEDPKIDKTSKSRSSKSSSSQRQSSEDVKKNIPDSLIQFGLAKIFQPDSDESPEYLRNLQNIQNTMGEFSDMYDWVMMQSRHFNWSNEIETLRNLQIIMVITGLLGLIVYFTPIKFIFLSFGLSVYAMNTRFSKYMIKELQPYMVQSGKESLQSLESQYMTLEDKYDHEDVVQEISVYENQRWWSEQGYTHNMLQGERTPWSDFTGTIDMPIITEVEAPKGYEWKETSEWKLDTSGPWMNDSLGIEIFVIPDKDGWIYRNHDWVISRPQVTPVDNFNEEQNSKALTRSRRWVRECERVPKQA